MSVPCTADGEQVSIMAKLQTGQGLRARLGWSSDASSSGSAARLRPAAAALLAHRTRHQLPCACTGAAGCAAASASAGALAASGAPSGCSCSRMVHRSFKHPALHVTGRSPSQTPNMHARQKLALTPNGNTLQGKINCRYPSESGTSESYISSAVAELLALAASSSACLLPAAAALAASSSFSNSRTCVVRQPLKHPTPACRGCVR